MGEGALLSASSIQRLKGKWQVEYEGWRRQDLSALELVYQWADGIYVKAGFEKDKAALLVMGGTKEWGEGSRDVREWGSGEQGVVAWGTA